MRRSRAPVDQPVDQSGTDMDPVAQLAEALAQLSGPTSVVSGPEWTHQFQPPVIPGTANATYTKAALPIRALGFFLLWVTWDWKRGAFVAVVAALILILIKTR